MAKYKRKKLFVAPKVQGLLIARVIIYWLASMATIEFVRLTWHIATAPEQANFLAYFTSHEWGAVCGRLLLASLLLVPITWDMLVFSNRFAGPVFRMRRVLREVAQGQVVAPVRLRDGDYWHGFADDLNAALARVAPEQLSHMPSRGEAGKASNADSKEAVASDVGLADNIAIFQ